MELTAFSHWLVILLVLRHLVVFHIAVTDQLLVALLLLKLILLLVHISEALLFFLLLGLSVGFLLGNALAFLFLPATFSILFLFAAGFLLRSLRLFSLFGGSLSLRLGLSLHLHLRLFILLSCSAIVRRATAQDLSDVWGGVDASSGGTEHGLQEEVGLFGLVASDDFGRLHIQLLRRHELRNLNQLHQEVDLGLFLGDGLCIDLVCSEETSAEAGSSLRGRVDVV